MLGLRWDKRGCKETYCVSAIDPSLLLACLLLSTDTIYRRHVSDCFVDSTELVEVLEVNRTVPSSFSDDVKRFGGVAWNKGSTQRAVTGSVRVHFLICITTDSENTALTSTFIEITTFNVFNVSYFSLYRVLQIMNNGSLSSLSYSVTVNTCYTI